MADASSQHTPSPYHVPSLNDAEDFVDLSQDNDLLGDFWSELALTCTERSREDEAKAYGKMARQLQKQQKFSEAVTYCKIQLSVCRTIANKVVCLLCPLIMQLWAGIVGCVRSGSLYTGNHLSFQRQALYHETNRVT